MKELTIGQKAQRYDEAIKKLRDFYRDYDTVSLLIDVKEELANLLPELKESEESEDERIRKNCIHFLELQKQHHAATFEIEECIDWLEKKGEQSKEAAYTHEVETGNGNIKALVTEKVQLPKFKVGDKVYSLRDRFECTIESVDETVYYGDTTNFDIKDQDDWELVEQKPADKVSLDFKKGDILYEQKTMSILLVYERNGSWLMTFCDYWMLKEKFHIEFPYENYGFVREMSLVHATKEQRDLLFQKMKKAGYEWDAEKKELKKIEDEEYNGEDYGIDSLYHAQRILEKTLGKVDGYQSDDGVLEHKCAISAVKKLYEQNHAWSEEDEKKFYDILAILRGGENCYYNSPTLIVWLKSLKDRCTWKPSEEQMDALDYYANSLCTYCDRQDDLRSLLHDLKKL